MCPMLNQLPTVFCCSCPLGMRHLSTDRIHTDAQFIEHYALATSGGSRQISINFVNVDRSVCLVEGFGVSAFRPAAVHHDSRAMCLPATRQAFTIARAVCVTLSVTVCARIAPSQEIVASCDRNLVEDSSNNIIIINNIAGDLTCLYWLSPMLTAWVRG